MNPVLVMVWVLYVAGLVNASHAKYVRDSAKEDFAYADSLHKQPKHKAKHKCI